MSSLASQTNRTKHSSLLTRMNQRKPAGFSGCRTSEGKLKISNRIQAIAKEQVDRVCCEDQKLLVDEFFHWHKSLEEDSTAVMNEFQELFQKMFDNQGAMRMYLQQVYDQEGNPVLPTEKSELLELYFKHMVARDMDPRLVSSVGAILKQYLPIETLSEARNDINDSRQEQLRQLKAVQLASCLTSLASFKKCSEPTIEFLEGIKVALETRQKDKPMTRDGIFRLFGRSKSGARMREMTLADYRSENTQIFAFLDVLEVRISHDLESLRAKLQGTCVKPNMSLLKIDASELDEMQVAARKRMHEECWVELNGTIPVKPTDFEKKDAMEQIQIAMGVTASKSQERIFSLGNSKAPLDLSTDIGRKLASEFGVDNSSMKIDDVQEKPILKTCLLNESEGKGPVCQVASNIFSYPLVDAMIATYNSRDIQYVRTPKTKTSYSRTNCRKPKKIKGKVTKKGKHKKKEKFSIPIRVGTDGFVASEEPTSKEESLQDFFGSLMNISVQDLRHCLECWDVNTDHITLIKYNGGIIKIGFHGGGTYMCHNDRAGNMVTTPGTLRECSFTGGNLPNQVELTVSTLILSNVEGLNGWVLWSDDKEALAGVDGESIIRAGGIDGFVANNDFIKAGIETRGRSCNHVQWFGMNSERLYHRSIPNRDHGAIETFGSVQPSAPDPSQKTDKDRPDDLPDLVDRQPGDDDEDSPYRPHGTLEDSTPAVTPIRFVLTFRTFAVTGDKGFEDGLKEDGYNVSTARAMQERMKTKFWNVWRDAKAIGHDDEDESDFQEEEELSEGEEETDSQQPSMARKKIQSRYPKADKDELEKFFTWGGTKYSSPPIVRNTKTLALPRNKASTLEWLSSYHVAVRALREHNVIFRQKGTKKKGQKYATNVDSILTHPDTAVPYYIGQKVPLEKLNNIVDTNAFSGAVLPKPKHQCNAVVLQHPYKSKLEELRRSLVQGNVFEQKMKEHLKKELKQTKKLSELAEGAVDVESAGLEDIDLRSDLIFYGFGGSLQPKGSTGLTVRCMSQDDSAWTAAFNQTTSEESKSENNNDILDSLADTGRVLAIFANLANMNLDKNKKNANMVQFLGYMRIKKAPKVEPLEYKCDADFDNTIISALEKYWQDRDDALDYAKAYFKANKQNFTFLVCRHFRVEAEHVFTLEDYIQFFIQQNLHKNRPKLHKIVKLDDEKDLFEISILRESLPKDEHGKEKKWYGLYHYLDILKIYGDTDVWMKDLGLYYKKGELVQAGASTTPSPTEEEFFFAKAKNYSFDAWEILGIAALANAAGAARGILGDDNEPLYSIKSAEDGVSYGTYIDAPDCAYLQSTTRCKPLPLADRAGDVNVRSSAPSLRVILGLKPGEDDVVDPPIDDQGLPLPDWKSRMNKAIFAMLCYEVTGVPAYYADFCAENKLGNCFLPHTPDQVKLFIQYLKNTVADQEKGRIASIISDQKGKTIPEELYDVSKMESFLTRASALFLTDERLFPFWDFSSRKQTLVALGDQICYFVTGVIDKQRWPKKLRRRASNVAHYTLAGLEEILAHPFGYVVDCTHLQLGFGASQGIETARKLVCKNRELPLKDSLKATLQDLDYDNPNIRDLLDLQKIHDTIIECLRLLADDVVFLCALGLKKKSLRRKYKSTAKEPEWIWRDNGNIAFAFVHIQNSRPYCITDTEHALCKVWVVVASTHVSRSESLYPIPSVSHCWPAYIGPCDQNTSWHIRSGREIFKQIYLSYVEGRKRKHDGILKPILYPPQLLRQGEILYNDVNPWIPPTVQQQMQQRMAKRRSETKALNASKRRRKSDRQ